MRLREPFAASFALQRAGVIPEWVNHWELTLAPLGDRRFSLCQLYDVRSSATFQIAKYYTSSDESHATFKKRSTNDRERFQQLLETTAFGRTCKAARQNACVL